MTAFPYDILFGQSFSIPQVRLENAASMLSRGLLGIETCAFTYSTRICPPFMTPMMLQDVAKVHGEILGRAFVVSLCRIPRMGIILKMTVTKLTKFRSIAARLSSLILFYMLAAHVAGCFFFALSVFQENSRNGWAHHEGVWLESDRSSQYAT